ncbi:MAG: VanZ family protein [Bacillota bacterium]|nr:VanZ family protein [Bacillota bacterium]
MQEVIQKVRMLTGSLLISFLLYIFLLNRLLWYIGLSAESALIPIGFILYLSAVFYFAGKIILAKGSRRDARILLFLYGLALTAGLLRFNQGLSGISLHPFSFILNLRDDPSGWLVAVINLLLFVPSFYLLVKSGIVRTFCLGSTIVMAFAVCLELLQLLLKRGFLDVSDLLLYFAGFSVGYWLSRSAVKKHLYSR